MGIKCFYLLSPSPDMFIAYSMWGRNGIIVYSCYNVISRSLINCYQCIYSYRLWFYSDLNPPKFQALLHSCKMQESSLVCSGGGRLSPFPISSCNYLKWLLCVFRCIFRSTDVLLYLLVAIFANIILSIILYISARQKSHFDDLAAHRSSASLLKEMLLDSSQVLIKDSL